LHKQYKVGTVLKNVTWGYTVKVISWDEYTRYTGLKDNAAHGFAHITLIDREPYESSTNTYGWDRYDTNFILINELSAPDKYDLLKLLFEQDLVQDET